MASAGVAAKIKRARVQIDQNIDDEQFYDALCTVKSLTTRLARDMDRNAVFVDYAKKFLQLRQYELVSDLASHLISFPYTDLLARAALEITFLVTAPLDAHGTGFPKSHLIDKFFVDLTRWGEKYSKNSKDNDCLLQAYPAIAEYYWLGGSLRQAQFYFLQNIKQSTVRYADLIIEWSKLGFASERDLFFLRGALIILGYKEQEKDIEEAESYLSYIASQPGCTHWMITEHLTCPCAQVAHFLVMALKMENSAFFDKVVTKYTLVLRRDSALQNLIQSIRQKHFSSGQAGFLSSIFGFH
eukprot:GEMP01040305.1.p1 GENE.GEMP01040305.1~~GEMP01040305.1.p1  ORF type:complete len:299 (+),score=42.56 GEMP01040305.1:334-1230(+)